MHKADASGHQRASRQRPASRGPQAFTDTLAHTGGVASRPSLSGSGAEGTSVLRGTWDLSS